ncbi:hypothetical protein [Paraburkholderia diazotrophica]|uniref:hypothetical protein n=1 Tax=Paraburkholderia diazotrophica TaxID=667676 RepID=UPI00316E3DA5
MDALLDQYGQRLDLAADASTLARKYLSADSLVLAQVDDAREAAAALHGSPDIVDTRAHRSNTSTSCNVNSPRPSRN